MRAWAWSVLLILLVLVFGLILYFGGDDPHKEPVRTVNLEVEEGAVEFQDQTIRGGEKITATPKIPTDNDTAETKPDATPAQVLETTDTEPTTLQTPISNALTVRVIDALGDLISDATVEIAGTIYDASSGRISIEDLSEGAQIITAYADGYTSSSKKVQVPTRETMDIELEYTCSFVIAVFDKKEGGRPVSGAEVTIYEGPKVERPVRKVITLETGNPNDPRESAVCRVRRDGDEIKVISTERTLTPRHELPSKETNPMKGDSIIGFCGSMWRAGEFTHYPYPSDLRGWPIHSRLRIWDSLTALAELGPRESWDGYIEIEREGSFCNYSYCISESYDESKIAVRGQTDERGQCRFKDLPPRIYFANAEKGNARGSCRAVFPAKGWEMTWLTDQSQNHVGIEVLKSGIGNNQQGRGIFNADVRLKGLQGMSLFTAKTDKFGTTRFQAVPWGKYLVTATLPQNAKTEENSKEVEIDVKDGLTWKKIAFDMSSAFDVSGQVLQADTDTPVAGIPIQIRTERSHREFAVAFSDEDGRFIFERVDPGDYLLVADIGKYNYNGFLPPLGNPQTPNKDSAPKNLTITVENKDIENLKYYVYLGLLTRFNGQVVNAKGVPIGEAEISVFAGNYGFAVSGEKSGADGRFELVMMYPDTGITYEAKISATIVERSTKKLSGNVGMASSGVAAAGSVPVEFKTGDTISGIEIVVEAEDVGCVVYGTILKPNGAVYDVPFGMQISGWQKDNRNIHGGMSDGGMYRLQGLKPGTFSLYASPSLAARGANRPDPTPKPSFCSSRVKLEMPEGQESMEYDITLEEGSYLLGKIIDQNREPVMDVYVKAEAENSRCFTNTNQNGMFYLDGLRSDVKHTITVSLENRGQVLETLEGIVPPANNVVIQVEIKE